ncbi:fibronectin type III domain-containing protein [Myxococcota bacterium]|nr:fibronectin type III domain-containing protein [Myxococcota bacterium]MBU1432260.1 fibronectin type III domain-containing protein [Myxococcota bacterium]MBU1899778.1 fibronectin type III domain-containing protein [Myxococcota bacterium]
MRLGLVWGCLALLTGACQPAPQPDLGAQAQALGVHDARGLPWRGQCGCDENFECRVLCDYGEAQRSEAPGDEAHGFGLPTLQDCAMCGRETGFLDAPVLAVEVIGDRGVRLSWDAVEDASFYVLHVIQLDNLPKIISMRRTDTYQLEETQLNLKLTPGYRYVFFVVAWSDDEDKRRSPPSTPLGIAL